MSILVDRPKKSLMNRFLRHIWLYFSILFLQQTTFAYQQEPEDTKSQNQELPSKATVLNDSAAVATNDIGEYADAYYQTDQWNDGIGFPPNTINLQSPQAALEHFIVQARNDNYEEALYAMNFNLLPDNISKADAAILAEKLHFVLEQRISIGWDGLPDRPDGQIDVSTSTNKAVAGKPRRSLLFGTTTLDDRDITFRVQRVKYKDEHPVWLISSQTVENTEPLYAAYGPRKLDRMIPEWISFEVLGIPIWKVVGTLLLILICYLIAKGISAIIRKAFSGVDRYWIRNIAYRLASPAGAAIGILAFYLLLNHLISFTGSLAKGIYTFILIVLISIFTWLIMRIIDYVMDFFAVEKVGDVRTEEDSKAKSLMTYISVGRRIFIFIIVIIGASVIFSQFPSLEKLGISLMASAGIATVVVGIAAQSTLGNIIAGVQIALTRPAKIGDAVIIEGEYGFVEDITFTYMVVNTFKLRRLVIPLSDVITESFENLSMSNPQNIMEIELFVDHRVDVQKVREKFTELLKASDNWDGDEDRSPLVEASGMDHNYLKLRCLVSAKDFPTAWTLHCELRENIVRYISELEDGIYLKRERVVLDGKYSEDEKQDNKLDEQG
ncbi:mechanosensitive ion channel family protein [Christiangramia sp. OXR-203]|uniref:mechanosensitive ion channel family protein n=1 Tax=Christiangramia sp. OXR-203 TaxID=3100176 RepID=UPI002AC9460B|nr:mechanosensitive ion channel family protein [Christiangramia sp. OXR-203]WPY97527.1 mechanosensitive ion channel family protein [Christiangramia sp. OXR-203]